LGVASRQSEKTIASTKEWSVRRIAYILDCYPVYSETFILREILELKRQGYDVQVLARFNTAQHENLGEVVHDEAQHFMHQVYYFSKPGTEMSRIQKALLHLYFFLGSPVRYVRALRFAYSKGRLTAWHFKQAVIYALKLQRSGVGHIHAHYALESAKWAMLISMLTGIPYSFTVHAHDIFIEELSEMMEEKCQYAKFVVCISEFNKEYVLTRYPGLDPSKMRVIHCGVEVGVSIRPENEDRETLAILAVGRLVEHKGFRYLIEACRLLKQRGEVKFVCRIIGGGPQRQELDELVRKDNLQDVVHVLGAREQNDVVRALREADLLVLPCVVEKGGMRDGIPVALMEAMAMGIPVISTKVSGIPELVKEGAGILTEPEDVHALVAAMEQVYRLSHEERRAMGERGRAVIEKEFNLTQEARKLAELLAG
jgi:colanic acid/amylovoran biosynthesis glycosyltransferase